MITITNTPNLSNSDVIYAVRKVIKQGKTHGVFQKESVYVYKKQTIRVTSWHDGEQTNYFHVTKKNEEASD